MIENEVFTSGSRGADNHVYHIDENCRQGPEDPSRVPWSWVADDDRWELCSYCGGGDIEYADTNDVEAYNTLRDMDPDTDLREVANR